MRTAHVLLLLSCSSLVAQDPTVPRVDVDDLRAHYDRVERELRAAGPVDAGRAAARLRVIDLLREYRENADFGRAADIGARVPWFVDAEGRRCAVGFLLDHTGRGELTLAVQQQGNHAWVAGLAGNTALQDWLQEHGLTLAEVARIQAPGWAPPSRPSPPSPPPPDPIAPLEGGAPPGRSRGTAAPARGTTSRGDASARPDASVTSAAVAGRSSAFRGVAVVNLDDELWSSWWDWNRASLLLPRRIEVPRADLRTTPVLSPRERVRTVLTAALDAEQAPVRAAAVLALGRIGSDPAVLKGRLEDSNMEVRMSAVLALGAHSSPAARHALLGLATARGAQLAPLAVVALVSGADAATGDADALGSSRVLGDYQSALAATSGGRVDAPALRERCRKLLTGTGDAVLRARAAEVLGAGADHATIALLTDALSGPAVDVRRSAALALGRSRHPLALPALMTAFELEHELLARAFLLLAIGDHGSAEAGAFLSEQVAQGRKPLRAWAALGLGLWGRERDDAAVRKTVRDGYQGEANRQQDGAWLLALGMLRDRDSLPLFSAALGGRDSRTRAAAADALALCGDKTAPGVLRTTLSSDHCPFVRGAAASALGICGGRIDVEALAEAARTDAVPEVRGAAAMALGALGSEPALTALLALAESTDAMTRAGALRGLGRIARTEEVPAAAVRTRQANFTLFPEWLGWALSQEQ